MKSSVYKRTLEKSFRLLYSMINLFVINIMILFNIPLRSKKVIKYNNKTMMMKIRRMMRMRNRNQNMILLCILGVFMMVVVLRMYVKYSPN